MTGKIPGRAGGAPGRFALLAVLAGTIVMMLAVASPAAAEVNCSLRGDTLWVVARDADDAMAVARSGDRITVAEAGYLYDLFAEEDEGRPVRCSGRTATIRNVDTVAIRERTEVEYVQAGIDLAGGPFGPGATTESDGTSEIELDVNLPSEDSYLAVFGSPAADEIRLGTSAGMGGVAFGASPEIDVALRAVEYVAVLGRAGDDTITAQPADPFDAPLEEGVIASGGDGADVLKGSSRLDYLYGGAGNDRIAGLARGDFLLAGPGRDTMRGGPGDDFAKTRGGGRDDLNCGPGRDVVHRDGADRLQRCERHGDYATVLGGG